VKIHSFGVGLIAMALLAIPSGPASAVDSDSDNYPSRAVTAPVKVKVPIRTIDTPGTNGQNGVVEIRVGNSAPFSVMVDTGIVGLVVFPGAWNAKPASVGLGSQKVTTAVQGQNLKGVQGKASMTLGGVSTITPVAFTYVNTSSSYIKAWTDQKVYGILGLGTGSSDMTNPLMSLPGTLGLRWSIHFERNIGAVGRTGELVLGAQAPASTVMNFPLRPLGKNINGALLWDDHAAQGCWSFGTLPEWCGDTWFDSGFTKMRVKGLAFKRLPQGANGLVKAGTRVGFAVPGSAYVAHKFVSGDKASRNYVRVLPVGRGVVNTGNSLYFDYTVTYNVAIGQIYLSN
jgi:hypothetical protein